MKPTKTPNNTQLKKNAGIKKIKDKTPVARHEALKSQVSNFYVKPKRKRIKRHVKKRRGDVTVREAKQFINSLS